jgi:hypothetical protein
MTRALSTGAAIAVLAAAACGALFFVASVHAADQAVTPVRAEKLPNVPGKTITAVVVNYAPGGKRLVTVTPEACLPMCCRERSVRKTPQPDRPGFTRQVKAFSSRPAASISLARTRVRPNPRACLPSLLPTMAPSSPLSANEPGALVAYLTARWRGRSRHRSRAGGPSSDRACRRRRSRRRSTPRPARTGSRW